MPLRLSPVEKEETAYDNFQRAGRQNWEVSFWESSIDCPASDEAEVAQQCHRSGSMRDTITASHVTELEQLGEGTFGLVFRGTLRTAGGVQEVAIKRLKNGVDSQSRVHFLQEASILGQLRHPNIVEELGVLTRSKDDILIILKLCDTVLKTYLRSRARQIPVQERLRYCLDVAKGCEYLESLNFIHRDLAARNILLQAGSCVIADFGLSCPMALTSDYYKSKAGRIPVRWSAPESIFFKRFSVKSDVWSYGILIQEIFTDGAVPYQSIQTHDIPSRLEAGYRLPPASTCPEKLYMIQLRCWAIEPVRRPNFAEVRKELLDVARGGDFDPASASLQPKGEALAYRSAKDDVDDDIVGCPDYEYEDYAVPPEPPPRSIRSLSPDDISAAGLIMPGKDSGHFLQHGLSEPIPPPRPSRGNDSSSQHRLVPQITPLLHGSMELPQKVISSQKNVGSGVRVRANTELPPNRPSGRTEVVAGFRLRAETNALPKARPKVRSQRDPVVDQVSSKLKEPWCHGDDVDRVLSEAHLSGKAPGIFLVRRKGPAYVISVVLGSGKIGHHLLRWDPPNRIYAINDSALPELSGIVEAIQYLHVPRPDANWTCRLLSYIAPGEHKVALWSSLL